MKELEASKALSAADLLFQNNDKQLDNSYRKLTAKLEKIHKLKLEVAQL